MYMKMKTIWKNMLMIAFTALIGISCSTDDHSEDAEAFLKELENGEENTTMISDEIIEDVLEQIPSPVEMSMMIRESGMDYDNSILSSADVYGNYNTSYKQALNLGIYGSDLLYTNIFGMSRDGLGYIKSIKFLADEMNIGQFFNLSLISDLATSGDNLDSLLMITVRNFNEINRYLQKQKRANLSALFLTGGWLEATYINCAMAMNQPANPMLEEKIGEQKIILENIMILLDYYSRLDANIAQLHEDMHSLKIIFDKVEITYTYVEPTYEIVDGVLMIVDQSTSTVEITHDDIVDLYAVIIDIRERIQE